MKTSPLCLRTRRAWEREFDVAGTTPVAEPVRLNPAMHAHLANCVECREFVLGARRLRVAFASIPTTPPDPAADQALLRSLRLCREHRAVPLSRLQPVRAGLAAVMGFALTLLLGVGLSRAPDQWVEGWAGLGHAPDAAVIPNVEALEWDGRLADVPGRAWAPVPVVPIPPAEAPPRVPVFRPAPPSPASDPTG